MWFEELTGFKEESPKNVRNNLIIEGDSFVSKVNGRRFSFGSLEIPTLEDVKRKGPPKEMYHGELRVEEIVADVQELHNQIKNAGAVFQAASQFNLLEMVGPHVSPEQGIDRYEDDYTQGPACAIACGAGTIYRNYFVEQGDQIGQSSGRQIDCLELIGEELNNRELKLWEMQNGYAMFKLDGLLRINKELASLSLDERESLKEKLKIGIQWNTEVTKSKSRHRVIQVYCSALPIAYSHIEPMYWEPFARVILEATYEATLYTALINYARTNSSLVYLTLVGGGAFGNKESWILESLVQALRKFGNTPLEIKIVSYGQSNRNLVRCIGRI